MSVVVLSVRKLNLWAGKCLLLSTEWSIEACHSAVMRSFSLCVVPLVQQTTISLFPFPTRNSWFCSSFLSLHDAMLLWLFNQHQFYQHLYHIILQSTILHLSLLTREFEDRAEINSDRKRWIYYFSFPSWKLHTLTSIKSDWFA